MRSATGMQFPNSVSKPSVRWQRRWKSRLETRRASPLMQIGISLRGFWSSQTRVRSTWWKFSAMSYCPFLVLWPTKTSHLAGIIEKLVIVVPQLQPSPENTVYILDGMAVIQMIKSRPTATFRELAKHYFNTFTSPLSTHKCYCVRVVFDQYLDYSIKAGEWARRGSSSALEVYIGGPAPPVPKQWDKYISNPNNKKNLCDFLAYSMYNLRQRHLRESTQLVIGGGFKDGERCVGHHERFMCWCGGSKV